MTGLSVFFRQMQEAFEQIKQRSMQGGRTVIMFVSPECDALCACHILAASHPTSLSTTLCDISQRNKGHNTPHLILRLLLASFQRLFRSENIMYKIKPASGKQDLIDANETLVKDNDEVGCHAHTHTHTLLALPLVWRRSCGG